MRFFSFIYSVLHISTFISGFDIPSVNTIIQVQTLAASAYCDKYELYQWNCKTCTQNVSEITVIDDNTRIIMAFDASLQSHFISFRGTSDINNWISDIETRIIYPYFDKRIGVHRGLYYEYLLYKERLVSYVHGLTVNDLLIITGHSAGSALASLFAYDLVTEGLFLYNNITLFTFGSPRFGNKEFVKSFVSFDIKYYRITYKKDIVPHLPQEFFGFLHIPNELWFTSSSIYKLCNDSEIKEDDSCSNSCSPFSCNSVNDHLNYLGSVIGGDAC